MVNARQTLSRHTKDSQVDAHDGSSRHQLPALILYVVKRDPSSTRPQRLHEHDKRSASRTRIRMPSACLLVFRLLLDKSYSRNRLFRYEIQSTRSHLATNDPAGASGARKAWIGAHDSVVTAATDRAWREVNMAELGRIDPSRKLKVLSQP